MTVRNLLTIVVAVLLLFCPVCFIFGSESGGVQYNIQDEVGLRNAIAAIAVADSADGPITIVIERSITLTAELPILGKSGVDVTIVGQNSGTYISGNGKFRGFFIDTGDTTTTVEVSNLQFQKCVATGGNGGSGMSGGGGGAGLGGAIFVQSGSVTLSDVKFKENEAVGGNGGTVTTGSQVYGNGGGFGSFGGGGSGSPTVGGNGGFGGGGGAGGRSWGTSGSGNGGFGGGGAGHHLTSHTGTGGFGAGNGGVLTDSTGTVLGGTGGGGLGAGGALFVADGASVTLKYTDTSEAASLFNFRNNKVTGGTSGGGSATGGLAMGNGMFLLGTVGWDTQKDQVIRLSENISGTSTGGIAITGGGKLILDGVNNYTGVTQILDGTLRVEKGEAIGNTSSVQIAASGILELGASENIGYLHSIESTTESTSVATVQLNGKTLTIGGNEEEVGNTGLFGASYFDGKIATDGVVTTKDTLVKKGTAILILAGDNRNDGDEFITEIHDGTIQLDHENALGGGVVKVYTPLTVPTGTTAKNSLQTGISELTIQNDFQIQSSSALRVGAANDTTGFHTEDVDTEDIDNFGVHFILAGKITGTGSLVVQMNGGADTLKLTNVSNLYSQQNSAAQIVLDKGTLAIVGEKTVTNTGTGTGNGSGNSTGTSDGWNTSLGSGILVNSAQNSGNTALRVDTDGANIHNKIQLQSSSLLKLTNTTDVHEFTLSGYITGKGGIDVDMEESTDTMIFRGVTDYTGKTQITNGTLQVGSSNIKFQGGVNLFDTGTIDMAGHKLSIGGSTESSLFGTIADSSVTDGVSTAVEKTGTGNLKIALNSNSVIDELILVEGNTQLFDQNSVANVKLQSSASLEIIGNEYENYRVELNTLTGDKNTTLTVRDGSTLSFGNDTTSIHRGKLSGSGTIELVSGDIFDTNDTDDTENTENTVKTTLILDGDSSQTWTGTIHVGTGATLVGTSQYSFGVLATATNTTNVGTVSLQGGTLHELWYGVLGNLELHSVTTSPEFTSGGTVFVADSALLTVQNITGDSTLTKEGGGMLYLLGKNDTFTGDVLFTGGSILFGNGASLGGNGGENGNGNEDSGGETGITAGKILVDGGENSTLTMGFLFSSSSTTSSTTGQSSEPFHLQNDVKLNSNLTVLVQGNNAQSAVLAGHLTGGGTLIKTGGGILVLTGNHEEYTGDVRIAAGTLQLGSSETGGCDLLLSDIIVGNSAVLSGVGTIGSLTIESGGSLRPGFSPGQLTVHGNFTLKSGSELDVVIDPLQSVASGVHVGGTATIEGGVINLQFTGNTAEHSGVSENGNENELVTVLTANEINVLQPVYFRDNVKNVRFVMVSPTDSENNDGGQQLFSMMNDTNDDDTSDDIDLHDIPEITSLQARMITFDYVRTGQNRNSAAAGEYLNYVADNTFLSEYISDRFEALNNLSGGAFLQATNEFTGEVHDSLRSSQLFGLTNRLQWIAGQNRATGGYGRNFGTIRGQSRGQIREQVRGQCGDDSCVQTNSCVPTCNTTDSVWGPEFGPVLGDCNSAGTSGWMTSFGNSAKVDTNGLAAGYDLTNYGGMGAVEKFSATGTRLGLFYSYGYTQLDTNTTLGKGTIHENLFGTYFKWNDSLGYGIGILSYGFSDTTTDRQFFGTPIHGSYGGWQLPIYLERGVDFGGLRSSFQPYIGLQYVAMSSSAFTETSVGFGGLTFDRQTVDSFRTIVGTRILHEFGPVCRPFRLGVSASWTHEYGDIDNGISGVRLPGDPGTGFTVYGNEIGRDYGSAGLNTEWHVRQNVSLFGSYDYQFNNLLNSHAATAGFRLAW